MWTAGLHEWFTVCGRHSLPWRQTRDPWAVLVSEVMLQQTSVARVLPRWGRFLARWPAPEACARDPLEDVLREWQGLGYPRRARALWLLAGLVVDTGWPRDEAGLRALPGVGVYTARALLAFSDLGEVPGHPPRDVNLGRVAARAALGCEAHEATPAQLDRALGAARPPDMSVRDYTYALFDVGATHCRTRPVCAGCPLRAECTWRTRGAPAGRPTRRRQSPYRGSLRELRGVVLAHALAVTGTTPSELLAAVSAATRTDPERVQLAIDGLVADGLIPGGRASQR